MHWEVLDRSHSQGTTGRTMKQPFLMLLTYLLCCMKEWLKELLATLEWRLVKDQDLTYKTLPVSRPRVDLEFIFSAKPSAFATNK